MILKKYDGTTSNLLWTEDGTEIEIIGAIEWNLSCLKTILIVGTNHVDCERRQQLHCGRMPDNWHSWLSASYGTEYGSNFNMQFMMA